MPTVEKFRKNRLRVRWIDPNSGKRLSKVFTLEQISEAKTFALERSLEKPSDLLPVNKSARL
jgi:hypothetical protein